VSSITRRIVSLLCSLALLLGGAWLVLNRQAVLDWWRLSQYTPPAEVKQLADEDTMIGQGRTLFYVSQPEILASADFNKSCSAKGEQTIVLGCYKLQHIALYNVTDQRLSGVKEVTAAHEMLHAAYERLSDAGKSRANTLLRPVIDGMKDQRILELIRLYNQQEPGELYNEMHSILGTEYANLTPELETYYTQYFSDRQRIVAYANQYQAVFTDSQNKLDAYDKQLTVLKVQIDQNNDTLKQLQLQLQTESDQLNRLRAVGQYQQYNQQVPGYNAKVASFNQLVGQTRSLVVQYNDIVNERNQQAVAQNDLYQNLNSSYVPAQQQ